MCQIRFVCLGIMLSRDTGLRGSHIVPPEERRSCERSYRLHPSILRIQKSEVHWFLVDSEIGDLRFVSNVSIYSEQVIKYSESRVTKAMHLFIIYGFFFRILCRKSLLSPRTETF